MGLGRTGCATPPTTLTPPRRMTTSAVCGDAQLLHGREDHQRRHLYEHRRVQLQAGENNQERATVRKRLFVRELQSKIAITSLERSKWRCARPMSTGTARSFPTSSPSPLKSRIA